jgi:transglutaminase-like putative cysteine protease
VDIPRRNGFLRQRINEGMAGIWHEVGRMGEYVRHYSGHPEVVDFARTLVLGCEPRDLKCEISTIHQFVVEHARFIQDPTNKEVISTPVKMLDDIENKGRTTGDCDELSTFEASLLAAAGIRPRFRFGGEGSEIYHVWVQAQFGNVWVDLEPSGYLDPGLHFEFPVYKTRDIFEE